jgi:polygalacturonase
MPRPSALLALAAAAAAAPLLACARMPPRDDVPTYSITDFGAVGDGKFNCTAAINAAVRNVSAGGVGGRIVFPAGTWFTAPFNVTSDMELFLDAGATLKASQLFSDWPVIPPLPSYGQGRDHPGPRRSSLIHGVNVSNVVITGDNGTVDGGGAVWWADHESGKEVYVASR